MTMRRAMIGILVLTACLIGFAVVYFSGLRFGGTAADDKGWSLKDAPRGSIIALQVDYSMEDDKDRSQLACSSKGLLKSSGTTLSKARRTCALLLQNNRIRQILLSPAPVCAPAPARAVRIRFRGLVYGRKVDRTLVAGSCTEQLLDFEAANPLLSAFSPPSPDRKDMMANKKAILSRSKDPRPSLDKQYPCPVEGPRDFPCKEN